MTTHAPIVLDVAGLELTKTDRERLKHPLVGGLILFGRNWQSRDQLTRLCAQIKAVREDIVIAVDHEGGRVQRFKTDGFTHLPPMRSLGALWDKKKGDPAANALHAMNVASACGYVMAAELRACGVDLSFTPVLDLDWGPSSVIGDRSFHSNARVVTALAKSLMHGLREAGMAACGKHFPGHGWAHGDSHHDIPVDERSLKAILADDAAPYKWLSTTLAAVMPAHVIFTKVDTKPAGFSARWLQDVLRGQLGFQGCIFSDDLSMEGARQIEGKALSFTQAALAALNAGGDMVLLCNQSVDGGAAVDELIEGLAKAQASGAWTANPHSDVRRRAMLPLLPGDSSAQGWDALMHSARYQAALSLIH
jgi:beta-N-acetylhexosaminidase